MISIAIDGPSGAGKSSLAKALAKDLGYVYVDTGAMYRSIGLYAVRAGVDPHDADAVAALLPQVKLGIRLIDGAQHIYLNGEDVSTAIRAEEIGMAASAVAAHPAVRSFLLDTQRGLAESQNILMDGRDIGTVVLPNATVKIFLTASAEARAQRRAKELAEKGQPADFATVLADIRQRDYQDSHRAVAPLKQADDAILVDTSSIGLQEKLRPAQAHDSCAHLRGLTMLLYWILLPIVWVLAHILFRFEVIGRENLKAVRDGRAYVIAPNHIANLDPVLIAITIFDWKRLRILAKEELFKNPLAGWFLRCMGAVSIERGKGDTTTVEKLTNECKNGTGIMIFPEGTRTKTGKLGVIKSGAFVIAAAAGADMLPGAHHLRHQGRQAAPFLQAAHRLWRADPRRGPADQGSEPQNGGAAPYEEPPARRAGAAAGRQRLCCAPGRNGSGGTRCTGRQAAAAGMTFPLAPSGGGSARRRWGRKLCRGPKLRIKTRLSPRPAGPLLPFWRKRHLPRFGESVSQREARSLQKELIYGDHPCQNRRLLLWCGPRGQADL